MTRLTSALGNPGSVRTRRLALAVAIVVLVVVPPFMPRFLLTLLTQTLIYAILAMSLDLLLGYTGLSSLGHAAYLGLGAYSVGILSTRYGAGFWTTLLVGLLDNFGKALFPELSYFTLFAPMALILALRPTGLFGRG